MIIINVLKICAMVVLNLFSNTESKPATLEDVENSWITEHARQVCKVRIIHYRQE